MSRPWGCRIRGCDWLFTADAGTVRWACRRCGRPGGSHRYADEQIATRVAQTCNRGASRPPVGLLAALGGTVHDERRDR